MPINETVTQLFTKTLRARRKRLGLTQRDLAELAGCAERTVRALESGSGSVSLNNALSILEALGLGLQLNNGRGQLTVDDRIIQ